MKETPHHVDSGDVRRNFKKTLNRNQSSAAPAEPTIPLTVATAKIPALLRVEAQEQRNSEIKPSTELTYLSYLRAFFR